MTSNFSNLKTKSKSLEDLPSTTTTKTYKSFYGFKSTRAAIMLSRGTKTSKNFPKKATLQRNFSQSNSQLDGKNDKNEQGQNECLFKSNKANALIGLANRKSQKKF